MRKIGIVGLGYVGSALKAAFQDKVKVEVFDTNKSLATVDSLESLVERVNMIFICLPTPMNKDGSCNISIVYNVIKEIDGISKDKKIVAIKSTIPPGTTDLLDRECLNIDVLFNPEFLTELNFINDFKNQNRIIIGGTPEASGKLRQLYSLVFPDIPIIKTKSNIAEFVKYFTNTFLATKVAFANEMKKICDELQIDYDKVVEYSIYDKRLGNSHWAVPGPDGKNGFGGSCFPKDINALIHLFRQLNLKSNILEASWKTNLEVRPEKDWENLKGRAVTE